MADIPEPTQPPTQANEIKELFAQKGELLTQIEIAQARLQGVNQKLSVLLNVKP